MLGYVIAFLVCMILFIYFMYDGTLWKKRKQVVVDERVEKPTEDTKEKQLLMYLREHVYKQLSFEFQQLKDSKNGYYYEKGPYSLTVFEYPTYRTAQLFQVKPYQQIAVMRGNKGSFDTIEVDYKDVPEQAKVLVRQYFEKVKNMNLNNVHNTMIDDEIQHAYGRLVGLIEKMSNEQKLLSLELKHELKRMTQFDVPELMQQYQKLPTYDLQTGKMRIKERLENMEQELEQKWKKILEEKRLDYERIVSLSE